MSYNHIIYVLKFFRFFFFTLNRLLGGCYAVLYNSFGYNNISTTAIIDNITHELL